MTTDSKEALIEKVFEQMIKDFRDKEYSPIYELLSHVPTNTLEGFLAEVEFYEKFFPRDNVENR
jgi:hypothetical protein